MRRIIYEYDETKPTNKDYLIAILTDNIDDGGASYESMAEMYIDCPYLRSADCYNDHFGHQYGSVDYREGCVRCKLAWLQRPCDTYPSYDGIWEVTE